MKNIFSYLLIAVLGFCSCQSALSAKQVTRKNVVKPIMVNVPVRPAGQKDVINLVTPKMDVVRVGFIGLGMRGSGTVELYTHIDGVKIVALCDLDQEKVQKCQDALTKAGLPKAAEYSGNDNAWKKLCERNDIDLVVIVTDWPHHTPMALYAMEHAKNVAIEVPAATNMKEIWSLINTSEKTRKHCMMLENCVYDFFELTTLNMAQHDVFGEILHVEGSYIHNLDDVWGQYWNNWRLDFNEKHRGDVYPTHGLGPVCQLLNIHRGDKMNYLVSMDTKPVNAPAMIKQKTGRVVTDFKNGEHTITLIRTEKGKTILIQHDVVDPRPYNRMYQLTGTQGFANKYPVEGYCLRPSQIPSDIASKFGNVVQHEFVSEDIKKALMEKYQDPIQIELSETAKKVGGHGGMDYILNYRLIYCLRNGLPLDMDVYDLAEWCCLVELTSISLENYSAPVAIPDFTRGAWNKVKGYSHAFAK